MLNYLGQEWKALQKSYDQYEFYSLVIKLLTVILVFFSVVLGINIWAACFFLGVLWLQDAIWKTFQARIEIRLVKLEELIAQEREQIEKQVEQLHIEQLIIPFQFNRDFAQLRQGPIGLVKEYLSSMLRPTVAYPYLVFIITFVTYHFTSGAF